jgi:leucyl-tRNA synthetase
MPDYNATATEKKWQTRWKEQGLYKADLDKPKKPKYYNLTMFPYPSGDKLHIGHWYNYAPVDTWGRYMRMKGYEVFQPMGFDAFGLPAENYAIKTGVHPADTTRANIDKMKEQIAAIGGMYDLWPDGSSLETSSPEYYKWTQWIFLKLYEKGLAYRKEAPVNWCPNDQTVLANEQVVDGKCERCKAEVIQKNLRQWFFAITQYAEQLLDYEGLDWPEKTVLMQQHWIGKSEGNEADFRIQESEGKTIRIFTTRFDTIYGTNFVAIAPEHPQLMDYVSEGQRQAVEAYVQETKKKSELDRQMGDREKTGVLTGMHAINPMTGMAMPIYVADFVLMYGTGALMGTPAHDERDFAFAQTMNIEAPQVVQVDELKEEYVKEWRAALHHFGTLVNSGPYTGMKSEEALKLMTEQMEREGWGKKVINYRLRDWLVSRQRYWGAPIPIVYCEKCGEVPVPEKDLPVVHPHVEDYVPKGTSPLATNEEFVNVACPTCGGAAKREVDTMDTFVCSSWYFLRYPDAGNSKGAWDEKRVNDWMPVDMYIGGPEHACMHLLYARFIHRAMHEMGLVDAKEPFKKLVHQGMVTKDGAKMSKSRGNVVSPDGFVEKYGSDVFRMYLMFMGPFTEGGDWNDRGITGVARFVERFYRMMQAEGDGAAMNGVVHQTIARASEAIEKMNFNVAIASLMELTNEAIQQPMNKEQKEMVLRLIAPLAPHLAEEVWEALGHSESVFMESWPVADPRFLVQQNVTYGVQVNGKLRGTVELSAEASKEEALAAAKALPNVSKYLEAGIVKEIFVPGKIIGFVVKA